MKKLSCIILCLTLVFDLCACGNNKQTAGVVESTNEVYCADCSDGQTSETVKTEEETSQEVKTEEETSKPNKEESSKPTETTKTEIDNSQKGGNNTSSTTTTSKQPTKPTQVSSTASQHDPTVLDKKNATCTTAGYTGDICCKKCNKIITKGSTIQATGHKNTEIRNKKEATATSAGYTGDTYCKDCNVKIATGNTIPKLDNNDGKVQYILPDGSTIWLEPNADILGYFMSQKTHESTHFYSEVEMEILRLCNVERAKVGLEPLEWFEDAYYFTQIRAYECATLFSHTRPNHKAWSTVYTDAGVQLVGYYGENLFSATDGSADEFAAFSVEKWMQSEGHRKNILNKNYHRIAIAIVQDGNSLIVVQNFFS